MKTTLEISKNIAARFHQIIQDTDGTQIAAYKYIMNNFEEYRKPNFKDKEIYEFVYINFYRLDRGISTRNRKDYRKKYFELLRRTNVDLHTILTDLRKVGGNGKNWFSYATKILHTQNPESCPIYDSNVSAATGLSIQSNHDEKYRILKESCKELVLINKELIRKWKEKHCSENNRMSDLKALDFMLWKLKKN